MNTVCCDIRIKKCLYLLDDLFSHSSFLWHRCSLCSSLHCISLKDQIKMYKQLEITVYPKVSPVQKYSLLGHPKTHQAKHLNNATKLNQPIEIHSAKLTIMDGHFEAVGCKYQTLHFHHSPQSNMKQVPVNQVLCFIQRQPPSVVVGIMLPSTLACINL